MSCKFCISLGKDSTGGPEWCEDPSANRYFVMELPGVESPTSSVFCNEHAVHALKTFMEIKEISKEEYETFQVIKG